MVDGQHRLVAVTQLMNDPSYAGRQELAETTIPVLLLVLAKAAGFTSVEGEDKSVLSICRQIFIDLNKHARKVSPARSVLLDDRDLSAIAMRGLFSESVGGTVSVAQRVEEDGQIPLALMDWSSEENKFDSSTLFLTSTLTMRDICASALMYPTPDGNDYAKQTDYVSGLAARLELDADPLFKEPLILKRIEKSELKALPFALNGDELKAAAEGFRRVLGPMVTRALTELAPYRALISEYESAGFLSSPNEVWLGLDKPGRLAFEKEMNVDPLDSAQEIASRVKNAHRLAFQVVFQKAFIGALIEMDRFRSALGEEWFGRDITREELITEWIARFDTRFSNGLADNSRWQGAGINAADNIQWTQSSQRAIEAFVVHGIAAPVSEWTEPNRDEKAEEWVRLVWSFVGPGKASAGIEGLYKRQGTIWRKAIETYQKARFKLLDEPSLPTEDDLISHAVGQLLKLNT